MKANRSLSLEYVLALLAALLATAFLFTRRSVVVAFLACIAAATLAGLVLGRHLGERTRHPDKRSTGQGGSAAADAACLAPNESTPAWPAPPAPRSPVRHLPRPAQRGRDRRELLEVCLLDRQEWTSLKAKNAGEAGIAAAFTELAQRFRSAVGAGATAALVVLELAPVCERARSERGERLQKEALRLVQETLLYRALEEGLACSLDSRRLLIVLPGASEDVIAGFLEELVPQLWRRGRMATKAGSAFAPRDGTGFVMLMHRARRRAAAARYQIPFPSAPMVPLPPGQRFSKLL